MFHIVSQLKRLPQHSD